MRIRHLKTIPGIALELVKPLISPQMLGGIFYISEVVRYTFTGIYPA